SVERLAGGLAVLLAKDPEGVSEVVNDLDGDLMNFWDVLRDEDSFARFQRMAGTTPFGREAWERAADVRDGDKVQRALSFFVRVRQSLAGRRDRFAPLSRTRTRRGRNEQASAWGTAVEGLPTVHQRLKYVVVENRPAIEVIRREDGPATLFYCDPPYLHDTRTATEVYGKFEMSVADHRQLLDVLRGCKGKVLLSGY